MRSLGPNELSIRPIGSIDDALSIANIRNSGREFMTHDISEITPEQQISWYRDIYRPERARGNMTAYIGAIATGNIAYGMIAKKDDEYWLTGIIAPGYRGHGFGRALFEFLTNEVADQGAQYAMLDVRSDNVAARSLYEKLGYKYIEDDMNSDIMMMQKEVQPNESIPF